MLCMKPSTLFLRFFTPVLFSASCLACLAQSVGIGTTTPQERLHVTQTSDDNKNTIYGYANQTSGTADFQNTGVAGFGQGNGVAGGFGFGFGVKGIGSLNSFGAVGVYAGLGTTIPQNNSIGGSFYSLYADAGIAAVNRYAGVFLNGNVGIGTTTPSFILDVADRIRLRSGSSGSAGLWLNNIDNTATTGFIGTVDNNHVGIYGFNAAAWSFVMNTTNGNVGIGTATPLQKIDVNGRMNITHGVIQRGGAAITATSDLGLYSRVPGNYIRLVTNAGAIRFFSDDNAGNNANMTIEANGNVGIGTTNPQAQLDVSGFTKLGSDAPKIKMKKLTGTTSSSDGGSADIPHGLNVAKILTVDVLVEYMPDVVIHQGFTRIAGIEFNFLVFPSAFRIFNIAFNSANILSKPVRVLITYEE